MKKNNTYEKQQPTLFAAIQEYSAATFRLAKVMAKIKKQYGRKSLQDCTCFDVSRINTLCWIGNIHEKLIAGLLPETVQELYGESENSIKTHCKKARKENLKASQLRKEVRKHNKTLVTTDNKVKVNNWGKHLLLLENELKQMDATTKQRALAHLVNTVTVLK